MREVFANIHFHQIQDQMLDILIKQVRVFIEQISTETTLSPFPLINCDNTLLNKTNYFAFVNDLTMIFGFGEVCRCMVTERYFFPIFFLIFFQETT